MEQAGNYNIPIEQGSNFDLSLVYEDENGPVDLAGFTAQMQVRPTKQSSTVLFELTTESGGIRLNDSPGEVRLLKSAEETAALSFAFAFYDIKLFDSLGESDRLLEGFVTLSRGVTR
jgi:hypothetical protein